MSVISQGTTRIYTSAVNPTNNEPGAEVGNFWLNTATNQLFINAVDTPAAQVWPNASVNQITQFSALIGGANNAITSIAPSIFPGTPLVSNGVGVNPTFSTALVAGGGTGATAFGFPFGVICAGTAITNPLQVISAGGVGQFLLSGGAAALPSYQSMHPFMYFRNTTSGAITGVGASYTFQTQADWTMDTDPSIVITWPAGIMTFTAPVTGFYCLGVNVLMGGMTAGMTEGFLTIDPSTASRQFIGDRHNVGADRAQGGVNQVTMAMVAYLTMGVGDTCTFAVQINNGTNVATMVGSATVQNSYVYGHLIQRTA